MSFKLLPLEAEDIKQYKLDMQAAFQCGFHITEFFNEKHPMPDAPEDFIGDGNEGLFNFEKRME